MDETSKTVEPTSDWSIGKRILFRFGFAYFLFYCPGLIFGHVPGGWILSAPLHLVWKLMVPNVGLILFNSKLNESDSNGSGDSTYAWVLCLCQLVTAVAVASVWSIIDFKRKNYAKLNDWLRLVLRLSLAGSMISYGAYKAINSQFPPPHMMRLVETYGESSPMGLLWTFMGASQEYCTFVGLAEMLGGALLIFPRFTTIGALVSFAVMSNVFMLNMCYDVPVKIYSFHLLVMSIILIEPDAQNIFRLFFKHATVTLPLDKPLFNTLRFNNIALVIQIVFGLFVLTSALDSTMEANRKHRGSQKPPLYGLWTVESMMINDREQELSDGSRWKFLAFETEGTLNVLDTARDKHYYKIDWDGQKKNATITESEWERDEKPAEGEEWSAHFKLESMNDKVATLAGDFAGAPSKVTLKRLDDSALLLVNRGFHWVNEYPFNR